MLKKIVFVGMMGSGKTHFGKLVSEKLALTFFDLDNEIEMYNNMSITDIFAKFGERQFRDMESTVLQKVVTLNNQRGHIISLGGGAFCTRAVRNMLKKNGYLSIYINPDIDTIFRRIKKNTSRPLLSHTNNKDKYDLLVKIKASREKYYSLCDIEYTQTQYRGLIDLINKHYQSSVTSK